MLTASSDDDPGVRGMIRSFLVEFGYTVLEAGDGAEALRICEQREGKIDVLLTDWIMPGVGGRELATRVAQSWPSIRLMVMSAYVSDSLVREGILKEVPFIHKPFNWDTLAALIRGALRRDRRPLSAAA